MASRSSEKIDAGRGGERRYTQSWSRRPYVTVLDKASQAQHALATMYKNHSDDWRCCADSVTDFPRYKVSTHLSTTPPAVIWVTTESAVLVHVLLSCEQLTQIREVKARGGYRRYHHAMDSDANLSFYRLSVLPDPNCRW